MVSRRAFLIGGLGLCGYAAYRLSSLRIPDVPLYVLAGQSNMSGRGEPDGTELDGVYCFGNDYRWHKAREPLDDPAGQVDRVSADYQAGLGPGMAFAEAMGSCGLIPCAKGGSSLDDWRRSESRDTLYGSMLARCREAGPISGLLFLQGEADAKQESTALTWAERFFHWVTDVRADLGSIPIVFAQIGRIDPTVYPFAQVVRDQQASVSISKVSMIQTVDLPLQDDAHFTTEAYRVVGKRFALSLKSVQSSE